MLENRKIELLIDGKLSPKIYYIEPLQRNGRVSISVSTNNILICNKLKCQERSTNRIKLYIEPAKKSILVLFNTMT